MNYIITLLSVAGLVSDFLGWVLSSDWLTVSPDRGCVTQRQLNSTRQYPDLSAVLTQIPPAGDMTEILKIWFLNSLHGIVACALDV